MRQVSLGTIKRLVEDLLHIVKKVCVGGGEEERRRGRVKTREERRAGGRMQREQGEQ